MRQFHPDVKHEALKIAKRHVVRVIRDRGMRLSSFKAHEIARYSHELINHPECPSEIILEAWGICKMRYEAQRQ